MTLAQRIKDKVSLVQVAAGAGVVWDAALSSPRAGDWWACCPFHGETTPSFHVTEKPGRRGVFKCHGCGLGGSVVDFAMAMNGGDFRAALRDLARAGGIEDEDPARAAKREAEAKAKAEADEAEAARLARVRLAMALEIWRAATPGAQPVADYLRGRGIDLDALGGVPASLRYHPRLPARDKAGAVIWTGPAMVACIGRNKIAGVHRTWIDGPARARLPDGRKVAKAMIGATGAIMGQPVRLTPYTGGPLVVGEGIETTLAKLADLRRAGGQVDGEAAMTLGALAGAEDPSDLSGEVCPRTGRRVPSRAPDPARPGWLPPDESPRRVIVLADPSSKSPATAAAHADRALAKLTARGFAAELAIPRGHFDHDHDFADLALEGITT